jgi:rfaE bifunctional protein nucleotidyltransferase chain/domain
MNYQEHIKHKVVDQYSVDALLSEWSAQHKKIVFTNGCFDLIHRGHIDYLAKARDLGDVLFIGVNTDRSVSALKGPHRPIQDEQSRLEILASFGFTDAVMLFDEETPYTLIKKIQPDILVKGSDYQPENIVGYDIVMAKGGQVKTIEYLPGYSTSLIEQRIKNC